MIRGNRVPLVILVAFTLLLFGCDLDDSVPYQLETPAWFPEMEVPDENPLTAERIALGRKLFYDPLLSLDSTVSCGSCHQPEKAFSDGLPKSVGVNNALGMRNAPTLANVGYAPRLFHDGGVSTLELQSQAPIFSEVEMNFSIAGFLERIRENEQYRVMFRVAYAREPDAFGISRALASFQRSLISSNSRFDQFNYQGDESALSVSEVRGMDLFFSERAECSSCHTPPLFTNHAYENIGLYVNYADSGRARITHLAEDNGRFKVPSLRNVELTAPYMHDGSLETLEQVVGHFSNGGMPHSNKSHLVHPLNLSEQEKADLVAFLKTLTDHQFVSDPDIQSPN